MTSNLIPVNEDSFNGRQIQTVNARDLHAYMEVRRDFSNWIKGRIEQYGFEEDVDYVTFSPVLAKTSNGGRPAIDYHISLDMGKELAMVERNEKGREVRRYFIECERKVREQQAVLPSNYADALRSLAAEVEQRAIVEKERDAALRTKAEIGSKREATAMATASAATRKANKLEEQLGLATNWKTAKAIPWVRDFFTPTRVFWSQLGKTLKKLSLEKGYGTRKVEDENFGKINAYHIDVIGDLRQQIEFNPKLLEKYRRPPGDEATA